MHFTAEYQEAISRITGKSMEFIDLKAQYRESRELINTRIQTVLDHGQYIMGPEVTELEGKLATYTGARHCVTVGSGTDAIIVALMALGIRHGDEVITTPFSFVATAEAIVLVGATPVFVDIDASTGNIDATLIEARITSKTRAIMPVSLFGQTSDMDAINQIAKRHTLAVIEDAAQSFGATYRGHKSCNLSSVACTSFFPSKPLGCYGDGGAIFTNDDDLADAMRQIRVHGQRQRYVHTRIGLGARMDTLQCAIVLAKLVRFDQELSARAQVAARYDELLSGHCDLIAVHPDRTSAYAQYTVKINERERLQAELQAVGIPTTVHYPIPIHLQPAYAHLGGQNEFSVAASMSTSVVSLPMGPYQSLSDTEYVALSLLRALGEKRHGERQRRAAHELDSVSKPASIAC